MQVANGKGGSRTKDSWLQIQGFLFITLGASVLTLGNLRWSGGQERWRSSKHGLWLFKSFVSLLSLLKWNLIWQPQYQDRLPGLYPPFFPGKEHSASLLFASLIGCLMKNHTWLPNLVLFREASTGATQLSGWWTRLEVETGLSLPDTANILSLPGPMASPGIPHTWLSARKGAERASKHQQGRFFKVLWRVHSAGEWWFWKFQLSRALSPVLKGSFGQ